MLEYLIRYFPEITLKSRPVRKRMQRRLGRNLRRALPDDDLRLERRWDSMSAHLPSGVDVERRREIESILSRTSGVGHFLEVETHPLPDLPTVARMLVARHGEELSGNSFAVRCRRRGDHPFGSMEVERVVGRKLLEDTDARAVDLDNPQRVVRIEIEHDKLRLVGARHEGPGGFPLGELEAALTLFSGGFDSSVAAYRMMRRGALAHFCFFELQEGEDWREIMAIADKIARYAAPGHRLVFMHVPFAGVVRAIARHIDESHRNIALKRMMLRVAERCAGELNLKSMITGDSLSQVASQTMANLRVTDACVATPTLRPLIAHHKTEIMKIARDIGVAADCERVKENCGALGRHPRTVVDVAAIEDKERRLPMDRLISDAVDGVRRHMLGGDFDVGAPRAAAAVSIEPSDEARRVIIDLRHPDEARRQPLKSDASASVLPIPFYELATKFSTLPTDTHYYLYCDRGLMSKIQVAHLRSQGYSNVEVYDGN